MWGRRIALVAHYENVGDITQWGEMHVAEDVGYVGFASVDGGFTNVSLVVPEQLARGASGDRGAFLHNWLLQRPQLAPRFKGARRASAVGPAGPFSLHGPCAWAPGAALVGEIGRFFEPFNREGVYSSPCTGESLSPRVIEALEAARAP